MKRARCSLILVGPLHGRCVLQDLSGLLRLHKLEETNVSDDGLRIIARAWGRMRHGNRLWHVDEGTREARSRSPRHWIRSHRIPRHRGAWHFPALYSWCSRPLWSNEALTQYLTNLLHLGAIEVKHRAEKCDSRTNNECF